MSYRSSVAPQKRQRLLIEFLDALVHGRVRTSVEHEQFGISDAVLQSIGETGGRELIAGPDGDVRRSENSSEMCLHIMREDGIRLLEEIRHGLRRPAPNECRQRFDVVRPLRIELGREAHGKIDRMTISGTSVALATKCQLSTTVCRKRSLLVHPLCTDKEATLSGCFTASQMPTAPPSERPATCALAMPIACMNAATSSASTSVV